MNKDQMLGSPAGSPFSTRRCSHSVLRSSTQPTDIIKCLTEPDITPMQVTFQ
ncbi:MAG: hypothetical protein V7K26_20935 [Nostoc sp.]|uniref:hypothetical protein n=1 Tax=Nostoc sp. TaxID=1180 RepID=UPI002FF364D0